MTEDHVFYSQGCPNCGYNTVGIRRFANRWPQAYCLNCGSQHPMFHSLNSQLSLTNGERDRFINSCLKCSQIYDFIADNYGSTGLLIINDPRQEGETAATRDLRGGRLSREDNGCPCANPRCTWRGSFYCVNP